MPISWSNPIPGRLRHLCCCVGLLAGATLVLPCYRLGAADDVGVAPDPEITPPASGQDPNGRIPRIAKPDDLPDPERWRYLPPARIKKGGFFDRFGITTFAIPIFFSQEATGTGAGVGLIDADFRGQDRRESVGAFISRTTLGQEQYAAFWRHNLEQRPAGNGGIYQRETEFVRATVGYRRTLTARFFGYGPDTAKDDQTSYTDATAWVGGGIQGSPVQGLPSLLGQFDLRLEHHDLAPGKVNGKSSTTDIYPELVAQGDRLGTAIVHTGLAWDTRDSSANPYRGFSVALDQDTRFDDHGDTSAVVTARATFAQALPSPFHDGGAADLRRRGPEENPPTDVFAIGGSLKRAYGPVPFYARPSLGGPDNLRGYLADRFTDAVAWNISAEWRTWILPRGFTISGDVRVERLGLAPFIDIGRVGRDVKEAFAGPVEVNPGLSLRIGWERALVFRLDIAKSKDQVGVNFQAGMAF